MVVFEELDVDQGFNMINQEEKKDQAVNNMFRKVQANANIASTENGMLRILGTNLSRQVNVKRLKH